MFTYPIEKYQYFDVTLMIWLWRSHPII